MRRPEHANIPHLTHRIAFLLQSFFIGCMRDEKPSPTDERKSELAVEVTPDQSFTSVGRSK